MYTRTTYCFGCRILSSLFSCAPTSAIPAADTAASARTGRTLMMPFQIPICRGALRFRRSALACVGFRFSPSGCLSNLSAPFTHSRLYMGSCLDTPVCRRDRQPWGVWWSKTEESSEMDARLNAQRAPAPCPRSRAALGKFHVLEESFSAPHLRPTHSVRS